MSHAQPVIDLRSARRWKLIEGKDHTEIRPLNALIPKAQVALQFRKKAFYVVQEWEKSNGLAECIVSDQAVWWSALRNQFVLRLADILPLIEALQALRSRLAVEPELILIDAPASSVQVYVDALAVCFPRAKLFAKKRLRTRIAKLIYLWVRAWRKRIGAIRLKELPARTSQRRVLLFHTETHWLGGRDKDMWPVDEALRSEGIEVVTMVSSCSSVWKNVLGPLTRPRGHIFADLVDLPIFGPRREFPPVAKGRFVSDGMDFSSLVVRWRYPGETALLDQGWAQVIAQIAPDYILMAHGHYELGALPRAALSAGIKSGLIQHGRITPYHALYIFPRCAHGAYPMPDKIFVYSKTEADMLKEYSLFKSDTIIITGSPEWHSILEGADRNRAVVRPLDGESRERPLRWLFTSQPDLDEEIMALLAEGVEGRKTADALRIRLHPRENSTRAWDRILAEHRLKAEIVKKTPLEDDLRWCDVHLTFTSTCVLHAVVAGRPSILLGATDDPWRDQFVTAGVGKKAVSRAQLDEAVSIWSSAAGQAEFTAKRTAFLREMEIELVPAGRRIVQALYSRLTTANGGKPA